YNALDAMDPSVNPRVLFEGPAGTGKTMLALEEARRSVLRGERVLFCCYNRLLGNWLRSEAAPLGAHVTVTTFHRFMLDMSKVGVPLDAGDSFWSQSLPDAALEKELEAGFEQFDLLLLDEAQDLLNDSYLDVLDAVLSGGLAGGRWRLFGDFEQQSIYGSPCLTIGDVLRIRAPGTPRYRLTRNCRNTPRIATYAMILAAFEKGCYGGILRQDNGIEPETIYFDSEHDQDQKLVRLLNRLYGEGYSGKEIVILSPRAEGSSAERITDSQWVERVRPAASTALGAIRYCTAHAFKGLEAPVVIVTDVTSIGTHADQSLFYIAVTRATERLYVLAALGLQSAVVQLSLRHVDRRA
ncbi:MAG: ATP-binding domain-containing protein, partial [Candidatus Marsarchaeota archaeon]|nr:ATP-binding domain-containing protein [Candidatus Marsarchaeota archaeon]